MTLEGLPFVDIAKLNCPFASRVIACGATLSTPVMAMNSCAAALFDDAVTVVVVCPFWLRATAETMVIISGVGVGVALGVVEDAFVELAAVELAEDTAGVGSGQDVATGTALPGQGASWPTMVTLAGGVAR